MVLTKLEALMEKRGVTADQLALMSKGNFSHMTIRRAVQGRGVKLLTAKAIAKTLHTRLEDLCGE